MAKTDDGRKPALTRKRTATPSASSDIAAFLDKVQQAPHQTNNSGRLIFALDATMSRQPTWDTACQLQAEMFREAAAIGSLKIKLVYFRGFGECKSSRWFDSGAELAGVMAGITCQGGHTQIRKVLTAALSAAGKEKIAAVVYVGDCMEEDVDTLCDKAGQLGLLGVPVFLFQEGRDAIAEQAFREIARLTNGAYCPFDAGAARQLADLLKAVAVYASGGHKALAAFQRKGGQGARLLLEQLKPQS